MKNDLSVKFLTTGLVLIMSGFMLSLQAGDPPVEWKRTWLDQVKLNWQAPVASTGLEAYPLNNWKPVRSMETTSDNTVSDGKFIYSGTNPFNVYDIEGNFLETFTIPGIPEIYRMTYDGTYFYATSYERWGIFKIDFTKRKLVEIIPTEQPMYHIAYIPSLDKGNGGFETGNPLQGYYLKKDGTFIANGPSYSKDMGEGYYCYATAFINDKLYIYCSDGTEIRKVMEYDITTNEYTGNSFDLNKFKGQAGIEKNFTARNMSFFTSPEHLQNMLLVDYNGAGYKATVVRIGHYPLLDHLTAYNIYRNGEKVNRQPIADSICTFTDSPLDEEKEYSYHIRYVNENTEKDLYTVSLLLPSTKHLPLVEDFSAYPVSSFQPDAPLIENYWNITPKMATRKWNIQTMNNGKCLHFSYSPDTKYRQSFVSRPLKATQGKKISLSLTYSCNVWNVTETEIMNIQVSSDNGTTWITADSIKYKPCYPSFLPIHIDLTEHVQNKDFLVRLKGSGKSIEQIYNWYFDDIKIWEFSPISVKGTVKFAGQPLSVPVKLTCTLSTIGTQYTIETDINGNFEIPFIESGKYNLEIKYDKFVHTIENYEFNENQSDIQLDVPGGYFTSDTQKLDFTIGENACQTTTLAYTNQGNANVRSRVLLSFRSTDTGELYGNNDINITPAFKIENSFKLNNSSEVSHFYYKGNIYTRSGNFSLNEINRYSLQGEFIEAVQLIRTPPSPIQGYFTKGDSVYAYTNARSWASPAVPAYLIPVDFTNHTLLTDRQIAIDSNINSISAITYNPKEKLFYIRDLSNNLYKVNHEGEIVKTYTLPEVNHHGIALDTFSEGGPYLWMAYKSFSPAGVYIKQYSLEQEQFTTISYAVNNDKESIVTPDSYISGCGIIGTTQLLSGYYSLIILQNSSPRSGQGEAQLLTYRMFPCETWISSEEGTEITAGETGKINVSVNSYGFRNGDIKKGKITITSDNPADDVTIPVSLKIDTTIGDEYPLPRRIKANVNSEYEVNLTWEIPESSHKIKEYQVIRDGKELEGAVTSQTTYTDPLPQKGSQSYRIRAIYETGYEVISTDSIKIEINNPNLPQPVTHLKSRIVTRKNVILTWDKTPKYKGGIYEGFEDYEPFTTNSIGVWKTIDGDKSWTYGHEICDYPHESERMAGIIYNPLKTSPVDREIDAYEGKQCYCFMSGSTEMLPNDDWLISPPITLKRSGIFKFAARTRNMTYGKEKIIMAYSTNGSEPADFLMLGDTIEVDQTWMQFEQKIPANTRYVALHYVSTNTYMLFVDNIYIGSPETYSKVLGYNIYRNNEKLNDDLLSDCSFIDYGLPDGLYVYEVECIYQNNSSARTQTETITIDTSITANAPRNLTVNLQEDERIHLAWEAPRLSDTEQLRYDNGKVANSLGGEEESYVTIKWDAEDMKLYEGYSISNLHYHIAEPVVSLTPVLFEDGKLVRVGEELQPEAGKYNRYTFEEPLKIRSGHSYMAGYYAIVENGFYPLSHDAGPATPGKSDLLSLDGESWYAMSSIGTAEYNLNWNIAIDLEILPDEPKELPATSGKLKLPSKTGKVRGKISALTSKYAINSPQNYVSEEIDKFIGYNIYRNDMKINEKPLEIRTYSDEMQTATTEYYVSALYSLSGEKASEKVLFVLDLIKTSSNEIFISPNPVKDQLIIKGTFDRISLYSVTGQPIFAKENTGTETIIPLMNQTPGTYILTLINRNKITSHKVIIK